MEKDTKIYIRNEGVIIRVDKTYCNISWLYRDTRYRKKCSGEYICCYDCATPCKRKCFLGKDSCHSKLTENEFETMLTMKRIVEGNLYAKTDKT